MNGGHAIIDVINAVTALPPAEDDAGDEIEDALKDLEKAREEFEDDPPDNEKALKKIKDALKDIEDAIEEGHPDVDALIAQMEIALYISRAVAMEAILASDDEKDREDALEKIAEGDEKWAEGKYEDAANKYKQAYEKVN